MKVLNYFNLKPFQLENSLVEQTFIFYVYIYTSCLIRHDVLLRKGHLSDSTRVVSPEVIGMIAHIHERRRPQTRSKDPRWSTFVAHLLRHIVAPQPQIQS